MKHANFSTNDRVPWKPFAFFIFCIFLYSPSAFCQNYYTSHSNNTSPHLRLNEINPFAFRHFRNNFQNISNEVWVKDNKCFVASFTASNVSNRVYYNSKGDFKYDIKSYGGSFLNKELNSLIHEKFAGYSVNCVIEISNEETNIYLIKIINSSSIKTLKCIDGNIIVTEDFINGGI